MARKNRDATGGTVVGTPGDGGANGSASLGDIFANGGDGDDLVIDPTDLDGSAGSGDVVTGTNKDGSARKRRGRKPGYTAKKNPSLDLSGVEATLFSIHAILAASIKLDELAITQEEAHQLAAGITNVTRHYAVEASQVALDWVNLVVALGMIYGTRAVAIKNNRKKKPASQSNNVITLG